MRAFVVSMLGVLVLVTAACGSADDSSAPRPATTAAAPRATTAPKDDAATAERDTVHVVAYFLLDGRVHPVSRTLPRTEAVARAALAAVIDGVTPREREVGLASAVPKDTAIEGLSIADGVATVDLRPCPPLAQVVFTLTQFSTVDSITGTCTEGRRVTRAGFEDEAPPLLVESPLLDEYTTSPMRIRGSANAYEATFQAEVVDAAGRVVARKTVMATSGSGTRGTFDETIAFDVSRQGGRLVVYEDSAEDGSRIHTVAIPLRLAPG